MFRDIFPILFALFIALIGGFYSAEKVTEHFEGFGPVEYGSWRAWPGTTSVDADPYARAQAARTGRIALASAEGVAFIADFDDRGKPIDTRCEYIISGSTPPARYWTLRLVDEDLELIDPKQESSGLASTSIVREANGEFEVYVSRQIKPNNWLPMFGEGARRFVLSLYDTNVASQTGAAEIVMPQIIGKDCPIG